MNDYKQMLLTALCLLTLFLIVGCGQKSTNATLTPDVSTSNNSTTDTNTTSSDTASTTEPAVVAPPVVESPTFETPLPSFDANGNPIFTNVSVHDPSVIKVDDTYYVFGSHLQSAKTTDLMNWQLISSGATTGNKLIPNVKEEMKDALTWAQTDTFWAGDVIQLADGKFYMYYCNCKGDSPRGDIGLAVSDNIEGPYVNKGMFLKSGMWNQTSPDGKVYDATKHPNAVDPDTFFDKNGLLWMVYGSYSGGIFILQMDPTTGLPLPDQGYGKKLLGGNHARIEGPYMLYSPESDYYYLFLSFGGLDVTGGYNIRVARSKNPDGPFVDALGQEMINCKGATGTIFDDKSIEPFGVKLVGNFKFTKATGEPSGVTLGYASPGHNSAYYNEETKQYYLIFHTRFPNAGDGYQVRVHQFFINADGWPVVAPERYSSEVKSPLTTEEISGDFKLINHGKEVSATVKQSEVITLDASGNISGTHSGSWQQSQDGRLEITIDGILYKGYALKQWNSGLKLSTITFTALSADGTAVWGTKVLAQ